MRYRAAIGILAILICEASFAQVYKCKDPVTGETTFTDKSCGPSGERVYVPPPRTNVMRSPERPAQLQSRQRQSKSSGPDIVIVGSDGSTDNYKRLRRRYEMEAENARSIDEQISARSKLLALEEQYKTRKNLSGSELQNYDRESDRLRRGLDSSRSFDEKVRARRAISELNRQHGGQDPFPKSHSTSGTTTPVTPTPQPSIITDCDATGCWDTLGERYTKGAGNTYSPTTGGSCQLIGNQMQCY